MLYIVVCGSHFRGLHLLAIFSLYSISLVCVFTICIAIVTAVVFVSSLRQNDSPDKRNQKSNLIVTCTHIPSSQPANQSFNSFQISDRIQIPFEHHFLPWIEWASEWVSVSAGNVCIVYAICYFGTSAMNSSVKRIGLLIHIIWNKRQLAIIVWPRIKMLRVSTALDCCASIHETQYTSQSVLNAPRLCLYLYLSFSLFVCVRQYRRILL